MHLEAEGSYWPADSNVPGMRSQAVLVQAEVPDHMDRSHMFHQALEEIPALPLPDL